MLMVWSSGGNMIIYLAGLQDVQRILWASQIGGANTLDNSACNPSLMTPIFLSSWVSSTFQIFSSIFVLTDGMGD